jgi:pantetheine-phosphate adenylyltransferase
LIYGDSGLGKTHLIYAIANVIRRNDPNARIAYVKGDELTNELVRSIREGPHKTAEMREKYRQADLLLVDDVQFIAGKKQTQEEFFHTFNTLYESGRQIVLTSDRPPKEMFTLEERMDLIKKVIGERSDVEVDCFDGLMVDYAAQRNVDAVVRGLRAVSDFEYEFQMALTNRRMAPEIETLFMMPSENLAYVTASTVREIASYGGDTAAFVTSAVHKRLLAAVKS